MSTPESEVAIMTTATLTKEAQVLSRLVSIKNQSGKQSFEVNGANQLFDVTGQGISNDEISFGLEPLNLILATPENISYIFSKEIRLSVGEINSLDDGGDEIYFSYIDVVYPETFDDVLVELSTLSSLSTLLSFTDPFTSPREGGVVCWANGVPCVYIKNGLEFFTEGTSLDDILNFEDENEMDENYAGWLGIAPADEFDENAQSGQYVLYAADAADLGFLENFVGNVLTLSSRHCESSETDVYTPTRPLEIWYDIVDRPTIASMDEALSMLPFSSDDDSSGGDDSSSSDK